MTTPEASAAAGRTAGVGAGAGRGASEARLTQTQERFLREAATRLPLERVVELHVFPAIRQGGVETGIAVIAAQQPAEAADAAPARANTPDDVAGERWEQSGEDSSDGSDTPSEVTEPSQPVRAEGGPPQVENGQPADRVGHPEDAGRTETRRVGDAERLTVFSARYRHTLKGPDRGRWEVEVVEEADAPLVSVDLVVRGVQRRAGEGGAEPERLTAAQLRALLPPAAPPPGPTGA